jgi:hypothetical protein
MIGIRSKAIEKQSLSILLLAGHVENFRRIKVALAHPAASNGYIQVIFHVYPEPSTHVYPVTTLKAYSSRTYHSKAFIFPRFRGSSVLQDF